MLSAFRDGLRGRGYVEGQNLSIDVRWPQGTFDQDPSVVTELVNSNVDVIVAWATPATIAAHHATSTIPIVMAPVGDPVEFDRAFAQLSAKSVDGVVVLADPTVIEHSRRIAELAQSVRLPTAFQVTLQVTSQKRARRPLVRFSREPATLAHAAVAWRGIQAAVDRRQAAPV
jgi:ABC-type uncharacterized transport system substrate-binding protein